MKAILLAKGWIQKGGCSSCGYANYVSAEYPNHTIKVNSGLNGFKIVLGGRTVVSLLAARWLDSKLLEL